MKLCCFFVMLVGVSGSAWADSMLTIDLPLVNGVPTLTGRPGQTVNVQATITTDTPLMITNVNASENTTEGDDIIVDSSVYFFDPNIGDGVTINPGSTTGDLLGITFADIASSIADVVDLEVDYVLLSDNSTHTFTIPSPVFEVDTVEEMAPEPSTVTLFALGLTAAAIITRRRRLA